MYQTDQPKICFYDMILFVLSFFRLKPVFHIVRSFRTDDLFLLPELRTVIKHYQCTFQFQISHKYRYTPTVSPLKNAHDQHTAPISIEQPIFLHNCLISSHTSFHTYPCITVCLYFDMNTIWFMQFHFARA